MTPSSSPIVMEFARLAGDLAEEFHFSRSMGQIYGLLYMNEEPLALEDIGLGLSMSKGNVSINIRQLEAWGAVRSSSVVGSRKDYYEANRDIKALALRRLQEGLDKRFVLAEDKINRLLKDHDVPRGTHSGRLRDLQTLLKKGRKAMGFIAQWVA